jgi:glycerophosphoryl diester phosphodiesterase
MPRAVATVTPKVIGHRGAAGHAPENTIASLRKAAELGAGWVEFDVKLSRDGVPVLFHDDTLDRTTDGTGAVADKTFSELKTLDAGSWYGRAFAGEPVPSLEAALTEAAALGLGCNIEIKPARGADTATARAAGETVTRTGLSVPVLFSSFSEAALTALRDAFPVLPRALLARRWPADWAERLDRLGCCDFHLRQQILSQKRAAAIRDAGIRLRAFTVNRRRRAETLYAWGVDAVFSDYPERLLDI